MKNKILMLTILICILSSISVFANTAYQKIDSQNIAPGVKYNKVSQFTQQGWVHLDIIEIDTTNSKVSINPLVASSGVSHFDTIKNMVLNQGAVAGINADYFARRPNTTNRGQSIGFVGSNSEILVSSADENISDNMMGSFILNKDNNVIYTYLSNKIIVTSPKTGAQFQSSGINKYVPYNQLCIYTTAWGEKSIGNSEGNWLTELVVKKDKVIEIRENMEPVKIPEDGYVISAFGQNSIDYLLNNFNVGDKVTYSIDLNMDLDAMQFAISGGSIFVRQGKPVPVTHKVWGTNEMSAIGTSKDNKTIYLIACKDINNTNNGISQSDFATAISDYGIYTALCFDGGGSTTLVAKKFGDNTPTTVLSRSSYLRPVVNGVGVFSDTSKSSTIGGIILNVENNGKVFKNNSIKISATVYDKNYNVKDTDISDLNISLSNDNAQYSNGYIKGLKEGTCTIKASYKGVTTTAEIQILGDIYSLDISPKNVNMKQGDSTTFSITATDKNGYSQKISNDCVNWFINGYGQIEDGTYTASKSGKTIVSASINSVNAYALVNINVEKELIVDTFEEIKGSYSAYPSELSGDISLSSKSKEGKKSLKLSYDFSSSKQRIRGAYYDYETPLELPNLISKLGVWVYSSEKNNSSIKSQYLDTRGIKYIDILAEEIDWTGWKFLEYPSASKIKNIVSIYVAQADEDNTDKGYALIDDLTVTYWGNLDEEIKIPDNTTKRDANNKYVKDAYCLSIIEEFQSEPTLFTKMKNRRMVNDFNSNSNKVFFYKSIANNEFQKDLTCTYTEFNGYKEEKITNCTILNIDCSAHGIRATDFSQWNKLIQTLDKKSGNILLILNNSIDNFSDNEEKNLLLSILSEYTNKYNADCWIIQKGNNTDVYNLNNLKILTIGNSNLSPYDMIANMEQYSYINVYITNNKLYYEIKNVF